VSRLPGWLAVCCALALAGCPARVGPLVPWRDVTAEMLLSSVESRREATRSLRARARLRSGLAGVWAREAVVVQRPRGVRVDVLSPFGLALALGTDGVVLWAYPPHEGIRYEGPATPENLARFLGASVQVDDLVDILLGVPPARAPTAPPTLQVADDAYLVSFTHVGGIQRLWFAGDTLELRRVEEQAAEEIVVRLRFDDYRAGFPHTIDVEVPRTGAEANLRYGQMEINGPIDAMIFAPPPARRTLPIESVTLTR